MMSETPSQTAMLAPGRSDVLPDHVLSPIPFTAYAELEEEFTRRHVARLVAGAVAIDPTSWEKAMRFASDEILEKRFGLGDPSWDRNVAEYPTVPLMLYLSLRVKHPTITRTQATALLTHDNFPEVRRALMEMLGFRFFNLTPTTPAAGGQQQTPTAGPSTSEPSSTNSETTAESTASDADSVTTKSAA